MAVNYRPRIVTDGLVIALDAANKKSYPGSGTSWVDLSGKGNNGTLTNGPSFNSSNLGYITYDGVDDYVNMSSSTYNYTKENSILVAFKSFDVTNYYGEVFQRGNRNDFSIRFNGTTGTLDMYYNLDTAYLYYNTSTSLVNNQLYIAQMTIDANTNLVARYYLNGVKVFDQAVSSGSNLTNTTSELRSGNISQSGGIEQLYGGVAIIHMYEKFLDENQIQQNFNALRGRFGL